MNAAMPTILQTWPAIMTKRTLRAYLDCASDHNWRAMRKLLENAGYSGVKHGERFHRKDLIDEALGLNGSMTSAKKQMLHEAQADLARDRMGMGKSVKQKMMEAAG